MNMENIEDIYILSPMQQGILFHTLYASNSGAYTIQTGWAIEGTLNVPLFTHAWQYIVNQHPILRTSFAWEGLEKPLQVVHRHVEVYWKQYDWRNLSANEQAVRWEMFLADNRTRDFQLTRAPLMRLYLFQFAEQAYRFVWNYHHLLLDGWSHPQVLKDVFATYEALCKGQIPALERRRPYRDYIAWLQEQDTSQAETFWRQTLKGFTTPTRLMIDQNVGEKASQQEKDFAGHELIIPEQTTASLQAFARSHQLTLNTLVQGAWALLLSHYSGDRDLVYGTVVSGRPATLPGVEAITGLFVNTLPVRARISPEMTLPAWLKELQRQQAALRQYEYSPLVQVQGWSEVARGLPLFETILAFENYPSIERAREPESGLNVAQISAFTRTNYPLEIMVVPRKTLALRLGYDRTHFAPDAMRRLASHLQNLLEGMPACAAQSLAALPILPAAERQTVLYEWNATGDSTGLEQNGPLRFCVHQLVESQAEQYPAAVAVTYAGETLTYRELNQHANQLASLLRQSGVGPEVRVGVYLKRSLELIVSLLAILKAGGAYVPLDPAYPAERLAYILADARVQLILSQQSLTESLPRTAISVLCVDSLSEELARQPVSDIASRAEARNLAYVMYTSGSTGQPKGVAITHRSIVNLTHQPGYARISRADVFLQLASIAFDASTFQIWGSLINGAHLVVAPAEKVSMAELSQVMHRHQVSVLLLTAGFFNQLVEMQLEGLRPVKQLLVGGEALSVPHVHAVLDRFPECQVINGYGPTENTTFACCYTVQAHDTLDPSVPIGKPIPNTQAYVLDEQLQPVPPGVTGELYVGGEGLARGYLNRPDLTAERFVPHPFSHIPGARLYRTGDLVNARADGTLLFVGRRDGQVKLRGFRVECGEIESCLARHSTIQSAVVMLRADRPGDEQLVAYLVPHEKANANRRATESELRQYLQKWLPEYMVPGAYVWLDTLPLTPHGKVDRRALPAPAKEREPDTLEYKAPSSPVEQKLAGIWAEVFRLERVGVTDNFFELGGHSILAIRLVGQIQALFQVQISLGTLFEHPTVAELALIVVQKQLEQRKSSEIARLLEVAENFSEPTDK